MKNISKPVDHTIAAYLDGKIRDQMVTYLRVCMCVYVMYSTVCMCMYVCVYVLYVCYVCVRCTVCM